MPSFEPIFSFEPRVLHLMPLDLERMRKRSVEKDIAEKEHHRKGTEIQRQTKRHELKVELNIKYPATLGCYDRS